MAYVEILKQPTLNKDDLKKDDYDYDYRQWTTSQGGGEEEEGDGCR